MAQIKISVVTVVYNGEKHLEQTILSVLNQAYNNIEYIIIDGGSTDGTVDIIRKYEDKLAYWVSEQDNGIYDAMNKGILKATGELVGLINADDYYEPEAIRSVVNYFIKNESPDILYGRMVFINEDTGQTKVIIPSVDRLIKDMTLNHPTCFLKRDLYKKKLFDTSYKICADYDLIMYFKTNKKRFTYIDEIITNMRIGGASDNFKLSTREVFLVQKKYFGSLIAFKNIIIRYTKRIFKNILSLIISPKVIEKVKGFK